MKRNAKVINTYRLHEYDGLIPSYEGILFKKAKYSKDDKWLYAFRDTTRASTEEQDYLENVHRKGSYSNDQFVKEQESFGTIVLESDLDMTPEIAYKAFSSRQVIEAVMQFYKSACEFDEAQADDYSIIATEFCDFLATVLTFRILNRFDEFSLLDELTYKKAMSILHEAKKVKIPGEEWQLVKTDPSQMEILHKLGLTETIQNSERKRGRPSKRYM